MIDNFLLILRPKNNHIDLFNKTMSINKINLSRTVMTVFMILAMTLTASATDFITDVMVAGNKNQNDFNALIGNLEEQGWTDINQDLNQGCGSGSDYIHLLYKKQSSSGNTGTPITGFYIKTGNDYPNSLTYEGRTYYLVPCTGSDSFVSGQGDLNNNAGGDYIHLYYTKDALSNNTGITGITFNTTQNGAVGENGGSTGYDLNSGCGSSSAYIYMHLTTASGANVVTLCSGSGNVQLLHGHILTGTGGANTHVTIADGATVTLSGVDITSIANNDSHQWPGISCLGNATIVLGENTTNNVKGGYRSSGIYVAEYKTLTLQGNGTLNATGTQYAAGIGSYNLSSCGNITINGGTVNATGGQYAAGIGSGSDNCSCGSISIRGGTVNATGGVGAAGIGSGNNHSDCWYIFIHNTVTRVTATKGTGCDNAIGAGGNGSTCQTVNIDGIETGFITQSPFVTFPYTVAFNANGGTGSMGNQSFMYNVEQILFGSIFTRTYYAFEGWATSPDGPKVYNDEQPVSNLTDTPGATVTLYAKWIPTSFPYTVAFNANGGTGTMNNQSFMYNVAQNLNGNVFSRTYYEFEGWATSPDGPKVYNDGQSVINLTQTPNATVTLYAKWVFVGSIPGEIVLHDGDTLTGIGGAHTHVFIADGATVTFSGVDITSILEDDNHKWPGITCLGDAVIVLAEGTTNSVKGGKDNPGIYVPQGHTLTLQGSGTLNVTGGEYSAGIGCGQDSSCGNITISGGTVTAAGGYGGAGIGSGRESSCGNITISGGTVTATGGFGSAGIGSGRESSCGNITISDGNITANGGDKAAGIGSGSDSSSCGSISISGGSVTTTGGNQAAGIGSGYNSSSCGNITINGGTITAAGGNNAAGIGSGSDSSCSNITISGGNITATGGNGGAGIGSGYVSSCGDITINGGSVTATGGGNSAGIGSGQESSCGNITISGGNVTATGGTYGAGIGSGWDSSCDNIAISGGTVTATGGQSAAGIGSGWSSSCGNITITDGVTRVTATKGDNCDNAIGKGHGSYATCGTVTIGGVETGFITQSPFVTFPYTVGFNANSGTGTMDNQSFMYNVAQHLTANSFTYSGHAFQGWANTAEGPKVYDNEESVSNLADTIATVTLYAKWEALPSTTLPIAGYGTGSGGWHLIASPMSSPITPTAENGFLTNTYDLYRFNQGAELEWENWKDEGTDNYHFNLESGCGYLYANQTGTTLTFSGTPYTGNGEVTLHKTTGAQLEGWNLIGNPFGTSATINKAFYRMNPETYAEIIPADNSTVAAMEGIFVVADTDGETVTFAESTRGGESEKRIIINLSNNTALIDRAIICFDEGQTLPKFQLFENSTKIYIPQNGKDYAVATAEPEGELPISFKAKENGTYTLTISATANCQLPTANLIDNLTGANVNLLETSSYSFEAKTTDYASRFKLVFSTQAPEPIEGQDQPFAFISNGDIIVDGEGTLQVFDILGQQLLSKELPTVNCQLPTVAGVYVLRLINGNEVKTQKIVVR